MVAYSYNNTLTCDVDSHGASHSDLQVAERPWQCRNLFAVQVPTMEEYSSQCGVCRGSLLHVRGPAHNRWHMTACHMQLICMHYDVDAGASLAKPQRGASPIGHLMYVGDVIDKRGTCFAVCGLYNLPVA